MGALHGSAAHQRDRFTVTAVAGGRFRFAVAGTLSLAAARQLEDEFNEALDDGADAVLVDLSAVAAVEARALHALLRMVDQAHSVRLDFRISAPVLRLLEAAGVKEHLLSASSRASIAHAGFNQRRRSRLRHAS